MKWANPDLKKEEEVQFYVLSVIPLMAFNLKDMDLLHIIISRNTWMYGGELDGVYGQSIDHFWNWLFILVGQYDISYCLKGGKTKDN